MPSSSFQPKPKKGIALSSGKPGLKYRLALAET
jgi:hypothetical protein